MIVHRLHLSCSYWIFGHIFTNVLFVFDDYRTSSMDVMYLTIIEYDAWCLYSIIFEVGCLDFSSII